MERDIDLTPAHLLLWLKAELASPAPRLKASATREFLTEPERPVGVDAEDGLEVMATVGVLEVEPAGGGAHWRLRMRIEDPLAAHLPEDGSVPDDPEAIDLAEFERCFLSAGEPAATFTLESACQADQRSFDRVFASILSDRHRRRL